MIKLADADKDGLINIEEFKKRIYPRLSKRIQDFDAKVLEAFEQYDIDNNGLIAPDELRKVLVEVFGPVITIKQIDALIKSIDRDGDGQLRIEEFKKKFYQQR